MKRQPPSKRFTSHDVASRAGVSQATVSLVLSGNPNARVATATREKVQRAAEELGYRPNLLARGLVHRRSFAIGVVVPSLGDPFYTDVVSGVQRVASKEGYAVLLCDASEVATAQHVELLRGWSVDGLIIDALGVATLSETDLTGLNVVLIDGPSERWPWVGSDAFESGRLAGAHLLGLGHRELAFIGPASELHVFQMRERGFVMALREAGVTLISERMRRAPATVAGGQSAMRALLSGPVRPTAVFCANDLLALGALKTCVDANVSVPSAMSLVGCDDIEMARLITPELTTVSVTARELGARAARLVIRGVAGREATARQPRPLPVKLMVRGSTGPVPEAKS